MWNRIYSATQEIQASCKSIGMLARVVKLTVSFVIAHIEIVAQDFVPPTNSPAIFLFPLGVGVTYHYSLVSVNCI